jgi:hypothetical protein
MVRKSKAMNLIVVVEVTGDSVVVVSLIEVGAVDVADESDGK